MSLFPSKSRLAHIVFEHDDKSSKTFDVVLLIAILLSVIIVILDSVAELRYNYGHIFYALEWAFTIVFTVEYALRLWLSKRKIGYVLSFYGLVDLLAIVPTYLSLVVLNTQFLVVIRSLRLLRVIRVLKLGRFLKDAEFLSEALRASRAKIQIFIGSMVTIVLIAGTVMYIVEGPESGFTSIPMSMYWAIVTLTTVGFGDITPVTSIGKFIASLIMLMGYGIIAVPTGIVTSEMTQANNRRKLAKARMCHNCDKLTFEIDAAYCKYCGDKFPEKK
ncbi:voltage-gated potassium channel [Belliella buryatensis]|uniref:Voltage-gated potassium channel n=1 Tax=Belliella buryatensis TaxID=1500549 RepID=A0A239DJX0_9BACT|nr:ion transporter [Belliella buryatensis]SNS32750.1 voltage-gated potassium channel [Belliella buryatensis]